jgi:hypothetical protein
LHARPPPPHPNLLPLYVRPLLHSIGSIDPDLLLLLVVLVLVVLFLVLLLPLPLLLLLPLPLPLILALILRQLNPDTVARGIMKTLTLWPAGEPCIGGSSGQSLVIEQFLQPCHHLMLCAWCSRVRSLWQLWDQRSFTRVARSSSLLPLPLCFCLPLSPLVAHLGPQIFVHPLEH